MVAAQRQCTLDVSQIAPKLYQGSWPVRGPAVRQCGFDVLVLCAHEYQPRAEYFPGVRILRAPLDDSGVPMTELERAEAQHAGMAVAREVANGARVLTTCMQGRNRSGFVNGFALWFLTGLPGWQIVTYIRARREDALTNQYFVNALRALPPRAMRPR